ncbi:MAG: NAD(P)/FAD-dependent oxidoreductase [Deltaproteobacteria bacterium]|nr:NAD(P)/FAD-dependent oxidoreductase [Deltaproteobacteria bacterium]
MRDATTCDVAIIGGGIVGCMIARELSRYRLKVVLVEKEAEVGFGTTKTNSGIIHPGHHTTLDTLKGRLVVKGNQLYDTLQAELGFGFRRIGELVVARTEEEVGVLREMEELAHQKGVPVEMWDQARLRREEPNLSRELIAALFAPTAGVINPYELAFATIESAVLNGVELWVDALVTAIDPVDGGLRVTTRDGELTAHTVVNAAGVFSDRVAAMVGADTFRILPRKGEEYMLDGRLKGLVRRLVFPVPNKVSKGTLIIPTYDGTIMVGPTAIDTDDRHDVSTSPEGARQIFDLVRGLCPSISERDTISEFAGLRAASDTGDFIIGRTAVPGFYNAAGIQSPGLTAAPAIALYLIQQMGEDGLALVEKERWEPQVEHPVRFAQRSVEEQRALVEADPAHGRVVCRCELVTEAEVRAAIAHGARTVDGVKFRTRTGMGRCQGGFCTTRVMELLQEELDIPFHSLTKRGGGSWMVTPMGEEA